MAETRVQPIYGERRGYLKKRRLRSQKIKRIMQSRTAKNFIQYRYSNSSCEEEETNSGHLLSLNFVDLIGSREYGRRGKVCVEHGTRHLIQNNMHREKAIDLGTVDKVFSSQWLNDRQVAFGTKCNKLMVLDTVSLRYDELPTMQPSSHHQPGMVKTGIHAIKTNPSNTMLATGAQHNNALGFYRMPSLEPVMVGEFGHKDCIFDVVWLDDEFLVSGSRENMLSLWKVQDSGAPFKAGHYSYTKPIFSRKCQTSEKVRSLAYNPQTQEIACLSLNSYLHIWNPKTFYQIYSKKLENCTENVCLESYENMYVVGCKPYLLLIDARTLEIVHKQSPACGEGIRSLNLRGNLLSVGSSSGVMSFFDMRARDYIRDPGPKGRNRCVLKASRGWVCENSAEDSISPFSGMYSPAIYTHGYDSSGTRLFTGGGPLSMYMCGHYVALWT